MFELHKYMAISIWSNNTIEPLLNGMAPSIWEKRPRIIKFQNAVPGGVQMTLLRSSSTTIGDICKCSYVFSRCQYQTCIEITVQLHHDDTPEQGQDHGTVFMGEQFTDEHQCITNRHTCKWRRRSSRPWLELWMILNTYVKWVVL
jgi:hypothetical protein